jgi:hypothetical protein
VQRTQRYEDIQALEGQKHRDEDELQNAVRKGRVNFEQSQQVGRCHEEVGTQLGRRLRCPEQFLESQILLKLHFLENLAPEVVRLVFESQT